MTLGCALEDRVKKDLDMIISKQNASLMARKPLFRTARARLQMIKAVKTYQSGTPYDVCGACGTSKPTGKQT